MKAHFYDISHPPLHSATSSSHPSTLTSMTMSWVLSYIDTHYKFGESYRLPPGKTLQSLYSEMVLNLYPDLDDDCISYSTFVKNIKSYYQKKLKFTSRHDFHIYTICIA